MIVQILKVVAVHIQVVARKSFLTFFRTCHRSVWQ